MKICIPTYNRTHILKERSLKFLESYNVDKNIIDVFVGTEEEKIEYQKVIGDYNFIIHGQIGMGPVRNFIRHHYKYNTEERYVLCMDDDIEKLTTITSDITDFEGYCMSMFKFAEDKSLCFWGICPFDNTFWLRDSISVNNRYICGGFHGIVIRRDRHDIYTDLDHGEDIQFTLEHFLRDGGVVRDNRYGLKTDYYSTDGGMHDINGGTKKRLLEQHEASMYIKERYGDMVELKKQEKLKKTKLPGDLDWVYNIKFNYRYKNI